MDAELTRGYSVPCERCSAVDWGVSDSGQFYCRSCHNIIERVREFEETEVLSTSSRVTTLSRSSLKKNEKVLGKEWMVIEGFQFILTHQADALLSLGVCSQFKDDVLWNFWRRYLQKTQQAFTQNPINLGRVSADVDSDSALESVALTDVSMQSGPSPGPESELDLGASAGHSSDGGASSVWSGSMDTSGYLNPRFKRRHHLMTMPKTLALCYLALLWVREGITLADLLRFVFERHIPYLHIHDVFPEEITLFGRDAHIFRVESIPSYRRVQEEAMKLARVMELPTFPPISEECLLHPALLSLRYLTEANLPDELHHWVCKVMAQSGLAEESVLTFDHASKAQRNSPIGYDLQACALIIVSMKLLFRLNDHEEWIFSEQAEDHNFADMESPGLFSLTWWYEAMLRALDKAKKREEQHTASQIWKSSKALVFRKKDRTVSLKRRRVVEHLQNTFRKLSGPSPDPPRSKPSSFIFRWGEGEDSDGPSFHQTKLDHVMKTKCDAHVTANEKYWHPVLRQCSKRVCKDHYAEVEATLPRMYVWLLGLFSFLLRVKPSAMHEEVLKVERRFVKCWRRNRQ
ncbi:TATA box-binding protein-associated factor RNA polymerase I subunit B [Clupea harengus]|uniref:TATA box-binding protein-associated factor RNA polymerase I subunit B n=1 Tax=Clupea harengus TaxID=7950 RepID=A0A6P3VRG9_CLUHA|nr:TATA box-binding protein-associated factor RNA polymerase I subunit B [Clupea harengus]